MTTVVFRADSGLEIGTGHVFRCLTLAQALQEKGAKISFICREHDGDLIEFIKSKGHTTHLLPKHDSVYQPQDNDPEHAAWLHAPWQQDAQETTAILKEEKPDWVIVDHYGIDQRWEKEQRPHVKNIMVIDDLFDRPHDCDILLDQTYGVTSELYKPHVPENCTLLTGTDYVLMRPEFSTLRPQSLARREENQDIQKLLITMGGIDQNNATGRILNTLPYEDLPEECEITIVMGSNAPYLKEVQAQSAHTDRTTNVRTNVSNMGELMAQNDAAIGAAGATTWERACLGLPTLTASLADNQQHAISRLTSDGFVMNAGDMRHVSNTDLTNTMRHFFQDATLRRTLSENSARLCDGKGTDRVINNIITQTKKRNIA